MADYFLSIIVPHYNDWERLCRAIESIPKRDDLQIIVVDDKTEGCKERLKVLRARYPYVEFYENLTKKKGAGQARNIGLDNAYGKWVCFMDADDYFLDTFEETLTVLTCDISSNVDIVFWAPTSFREGLGQKAVRHQDYESLVKEHVDKPTINSELRLRYLFYSPCSKFIRRSLITNNSIRFDTVLYANDVMFSTKIGFYAREILAVNRTYYCISEGEGSLTTTVNKKSKRIRLKVEQKQYHYLKKHLSNMQMRELGVSVTTGIYFWLLRIGIDRDLISMCYGKVTGMFKKQE